MSDILKKLRLEQKHYESTFEGKALSERIKLLADHIELVEKQRDDFQRALGNLVFHCVDYNQGEESLALAMEIEKASEVLSKYSRKKETKMNLTTHYDLAPKESPVFEFAVHVSRPRKGLKPRSAHFTMFKGNWEDEGYDQVMLDSFHNQFWPTNEAHKKLCEEGAKVVIKNLKEFGVNQIRFAAGKMQDSKGLRAYSALVDVDLNLVSEKDREPLILHIIDNILGYERNYHDVIEEIEYGDQVGSLQSESSGDSKVPRTI